jgi:hypothetical protein
MRSVVPRRQFRLGEDCEQGAEDFYMQIEPVHDIVKRRVSRMRNGCRP